MAYWHSVCPVCEQGRLFVTVVRDTKELFLLCEECESAWQTPGNIDVNIHFDFSARSVVRAAYNDVAEAGWSRYELIST